MTDRVIILTIDHKHGQNISAHSTRENAPAALFEYCNDEWDAEIPSNIKKPTDAGKLIDKYFIRVEEEFYEIHDLKIDE